MERVKIWQGKEVDIDANKYTKASLFFCTSACFIEVAQTNDINTAF